MGRSATQALIIDGSAHERGPHGAGPWYPPVMVLALLSWLAPAVACAPSPELRDPDGVLTVLEQNLKFIAVGGRRAERAQMLGDWLADDGQDVDLLLLEEVRLSTSLVDAMPGWCFYTQLGDGLRQSYRWRNIEEERPPGGLAIAVRTRTAGPLRDVGGDAGRRFRASPSTWVEGFLGRLVGYRKGWAGITVDGTRLVWSHTQASYRQHPERGAGARGRGRVGQFDDLAEDLGRPDHPTLLTGDLNLLDTFEAAAEGDYAGRVDAARRIDGETMAHFEDRTGLDFHWPRLRPRRADGSPAHGTFLGNIFNTPQDPEWDGGAAYDRVGVNEAFKHQHPGALVHAVEIVRRDLRVSDHVGLKIEIPFHPGPMAP